MVSFAIVQQDSLQSLRPQIPSFNLRTTAMWYPTVPSNDWCLNENFFTGENPLSSGYQPIFWVRFGGPNGSHADLQKAIAWAMYSLKKYFTAYADKASWNNLVVITLSEFGRTTIMNSDAGTDHAAQGFATYILYDVRVRVRRSFFLPMEEYVSAEIQCSLICVVSGCSSVTSSRPKPCR